MSDTKEALPSLEIMISTCGPEGGRKVAAMLMPERSGVSYLVSWQHPSGSPVPEALTERSDVRLLLPPGIGLSRNRNNCLDHACGDILLIADDDIELYPDGLEEVRRIFASHPSLEYASLRFDSNDYPKRYPDAETRLDRLPKGFYQTSFEIALRRDSRAGRLRFPENFGLGAPEFTAGEEELLLKRARINRLDCRFFPVTIASHSGPTTGVAPMATDGSILSCGALAAIEYPMTAPLRIPLVSLRMSRAGRATFIKAMRLMTIGAIRASLTGIIRPYLRAPLR